MSPFRATGVALMLLGAPAAVVAQGSAFNVILTLNTESAEQTVGLYEGLEGDPDEIARLPGSQIALATTALLAGRRLDTNDLVGSLQAAKFNQDLGDDVFRMAGARVHADAIRRLLEVLQRRNFARKVTSTVEQLFPPDARVSASIPMYVVAFGHQNVDAFVRRVVWNGDVPAFVGEGQGQLTIVVNLARAVEYGDSVDEQFIGLLSVVAHEVFHAAFGAYKDHSPFWQRYYATHTTYLDRLLDLAQNEGIAYYLTLVQRSRGRLLPDWVEHVQDAFAEFNRNAERLLSSGISPQQAQEILQRANTSGYWQNFGAIAGMIIARQIDDTFGRTALSETIALGPEDFFRKYVTIVSRGGAVPPLSRAVVNYLSTPR